MLVKGPRGEHCSVGKEAWQKGSVRWGSYKSNRRGVQSFKAK